MDYVKIVDRAKDVVKSGGEWISSLTLEDVILTHPAVSEVAVVGVEHERWSERPIALIVLKPEYNDKISEDDFKEHLKKFPEKFRNGGYLTGLYLLKVYLKQALEK